MQSCLQGWALQKPRTVHQVPLNPPQIHLLEYLLFYWSIYCFIGVFPATVTPVRPVDVTEASSAGRGKQAELQGLTMSKPPAPKAQGEPVLPLGEVSALGYPPTFRKTSLVFPWVL